MILPFMFHVNTYHDKANKTVKKEDLSDVVITPGEVYLFTIKGPSLKSKSLRKMLKAGPTWEIVQESKTVTI